MPSSASVSARSAAACCARCAHRTGDRDERGARRSALGALSLVVPLAASAAALRRLSGAGDGRSDARRVAALRRACAIAPDLGVQVWTVDDEADCAASARLGRRRADYRSAGPDRPARALTRAAAQSLPCTVAPYVVHSRPACPFTVDTKMLPNQACSTELSAAQSCIRIRWDRRATTTGHIVLRQLACRRNGASCE